jgi:acyl-CoA thioester hydrolase
VTKADDTTAVEVRVRYGEADRMGFAYHAHYLDWCDIGRTEHLRRHGVRYRDLEDRGFLLAVGEASLRYLSPAKYDDLVRIITWVSDAGSRRVRFEYRIERAEDGALLATAMTSMVSINAAGRPTRLPDDLLTLMRGVVVRDA